MKATLLSSLFLVASFFFHTAMPAAGNEPIAATNLLTLDEGETWTYEFHDLPFTFRSINPGASVARFSLGFLSNSVPPGTSLRWEAFETGTNVVVASGIINDPGPPTSIIVKIGSATWADLQGVIRLTMSTGSVVLSNVGFEVQLQRGGGMLDTYRNGFVPVEVPQPLIVTQFISSVGFQSAAVEASVNARNLPTAVYLEWGITTNYGQVTVPLMIDRDYPVTHQLLITNLGFASIYHVRTMASNSAGVVYGGDLAVATPPPATVIAQAVLPGATSAVLQASVIANGFNTVAYFEWGPTTNYGQVTPLQNVGNPTLQTNVSAQIVGLNPATAYHYRAVAFALGVTNRSDDISFTTTEMPVEIIVTNLATQNVRELLEQGGTIRFVCDGVVPLSEPIAVANDVSVDATGHSIAFSGGAVTRLFTVLPGARLGLTNVTLSNGRHGSGGAIFNDQGTVVAYRCRFVDNVAAGGPGTNGTNGTNGTSSAFTIDEVTAGGNGGPGGPGEDAGGGALFSSGNLQLVECAFENNRVSAGSGGKGGDGGTGGTLFFRSMPFDGRSGGNAGIPGNAGVARGGAIASLGALRLEGCTFSNSVAMGGRGGEGGAGGNRGYDGGATNGIGTAGSAGGCSLGAAIFAGGQTSISNSLFVLNSSHGGRGGTGGAGGRSGGLFVYPDPREGGRGGTGLGGAINNCSNSLLVNCTSVSNSVSGGTGGDGGRHVYGGHASSGSGGDAFGGALFNHGIASVVNLTMSDNAAVGGTLSTQALFFLFTNSGIRGVGHGGSIASTGSLHVVNSIFAGGSSNNFYGPITDGGHNLSSDMTPTWSSETSLNNVDPLFLPLAHNGGPTMTMALRTNSPALNNAATPTSPATDQRGYPRPRGPGHDIGAFEAGVPPLGIIWESASTNRLRWLAEKDHVYQIKKTADLNNWTVVSTNIAASNGWQELLLPANSSYGFFRLTGP